jgi:O-antigen ligase
LPKSTKILWLYLITLLFLVGNAYFIYKENFYFSLIPVALITIIFAFLALDKLMLVVVFLVPLSIPLREYFPSLPFDMFIPTEPLIVGIMLIFILKLILQNKIDKRIFLHPISIAIYINLFWMLITTLTSTMPLVSIKYLLVRVWFISAFYFIAIQLFKKKENIRKYIWMYILSLIIVVFYTEFKHMAYGIFDQEAANFVCSPFYNDHTSYGAALAFVIPVIIGFLISKHYSNTVKLLITAVLTIILLGLVFSYTRAAWLSLVVSFAVLITVLLKIKFRTIFIILSTLVILFFSFKTQIFIYLEGNRQDASSNFTEQVKSMTNIASDASNLERINRWESALRMFEEKPFFGFGPGTYMFQYAPYQMSYEKTIISTNAGDGGNAHSEYIGALAESGVFGSLSFILIVIATLYSALTLYSKTRSREYRILILSLTLGLISYYIHGFLNNFLDTDKISALFWGYTAIIVALEVYHKKELQLKDENS